MGTGTAAEKETRAVVETGTGTEPEVRMRTGWGGVGGRRTGEEAQ